MTGDDYYGWGPTAVLERPVVLTGFLGSRVERVGNVLAGISGHRHVALDRGVEHRAGMSVPALILEEGEAVLREHEAALLERALVDRPPPIVSLGHTTLGQRRLRALVAQRAVLVYVRISVEEAQRRLVRDLADNAARHFAWLAGRTPDTPLLRAQLERLRPAYEAADHVVDGEQPPRQVAEAIKATLGWP